MRTHVEDRRDDAAPDGIGRADRGHAVEVPPTGPELHDPALIGRPPHLRLDLLAQLLIRPLACEAVAHRNKELRHGRQRTSPRHWPDPTNIRLLPVAAGIE